MGVTAKFAIPALVRVLLPFGEDFSTLRPFSLGYEPLTKATVAFQLREEIRRANDTAKQRVLNKLLTGLGNERYVKRKQRRKKWPEGLNGTTRHQ